MQLGAIALLRHAFFDKPTVPLFATVTYNHRPHTDALGFLRCSRLQNNTQCTLFYKHVLAQGRHCPCVPLFLDTTHHDIIDVYNI